MKETKQKLPDAEDATAETDSNGNTKLISGGSSEETAAATKLGVSSRSRTKDMSTGGVFHELAGSPEATEAAVENEKLEALLERESSNLWQWPSHLANLFIVAVAMFVNLIRGSPKMESIFNIKKCGLVDWATLLGFIAFASAITAYQVIRMRKEQQLKEKHGKTDPGTV